MTFIERANKLPMEHKEALAALLAITIENYVKAAEHEIALAVEE